MRAIMSYALSCVHTTLTESTAFRRLSCVDAMVVMRARRVFCQPMPPVVFFSHAYVGVQALLFYFFLRVRLSHPSHRFPDFKIDPGAEGDGARGGRDSGDGV